MVCHKDFLNIVQQVFNSKIYECPSFLNMSVWYGGISGIVGCWFDVSMIFGSIQCNAWKNVALRKTACVVQCSTEPLAQSRSGNLIILGSWTMVRAHHLGPWSKPGTRPSSLLLQVQAYPCHLSFSLFLIFITFIYLYLSFNDNIYIFSLSDHGQSLLHSAPILVICHFLDGQTLWMIGEQTSSQNILHLPSITCVHSNYTWGCISQAHNLVLQMMNKQLI